MSRENFILKLRKFPEGDTYVMVHNIEELEVVSHVEKTKEAQTSHTLTKVHKVSGGSVLVHELPEAIERKASAFGVLKVLA